MKNKWLELGRRTYLLHQLKSYQCMNEDKSGVNRWKRREKKSKERFHERRRGVIQRRVKSV